MQKSTLPICLCLLFVLNLLLLALVLRPQQGLLVTFLDVGQGDAVFIQSPAGVQVLIDGGKDRSVLRELGKRMSPFDRTIDVVVATHPDADHIGGLPAVFDSYNVGAYVVSGVDATTNQVIALEAAAETEGTLIEHEARRGDRIHLGAGAYLDVLFPDRDVSNVETNTGSLVVRLVYGKTSFLLTGDSPESIEEYLVTLDGTSLESDVLKAGHHGSKTSTGAMFLAAVAPGAVIISAGKDNSYGHPHEEVVERIEESGARLFSTMGEGAVVFESNGKTVVKK